MSIIRRFEKSKDILKDLTFLTHDRLMSVNQGKPCPDDMFDSLKIWIPQIDQDALRIEYTVFSKSFLEFHLKLTQKKFTITLKLIFLTIMNMKMKLIKIIKMKLKTPT